MTKMIGDIRQAPLSTQVFGFIVNNKKNEE